MNRKKRSPIWAMNSKEFKELFDKSNSITEMLSFWNLGMKGGNGRTLKKRFDEEGLSYEFLKKKGLQSCGSKKLIPLKEILVEGSKYNRCHLKARLLKIGLLKNECELCGVGDTWNGKPLTLQLDHKNGVSNDHRLENLRMLCPCCHSQTETFAGKKLRKAVEIKQCTVCNIDLPYKNNKVNYCKECKSKRLTKVVISKDELEATLKEYRYNFSAVGRFYGISDNAIRKKCRKLNIKWKQ